MAVGATMFLLPASDLRHHGGVSLDHLSQSAHHGSHVLIYRMAGDFRSIDSSQKAWILPVAAPALNRNVAAWAGWQSETSLWRGQIVSAHVRQRLLGRPLSSVRSSRLFLKVDLMVLQELGFGPGSSLSPTDWYRTKEILMNYQYQTPCYGYSAFAFRILVRVLLVAASLKCVYVADGDRVVSPFSMRRVRPSLVVTYLPPLHASWLSPAVYLVNVYR